MNAINELLKDTAAQYLIKPNFMMDRGKILQGIEKNPHIRMEVKGKYLIFHYDQNP